MKINKFIPLTEIFPKIEDPRSAHGRRHRLDVVLLMCIMAIMGGYTSYRGMGRFFKNNKRDFQEYFDLPHGVPCYVTIREILQSIDFDNFSKLFNQWAMQYVPMCKGDTKAGDGKGIGSTTSNAHNSFQNFVSLVSIFSSKRGIVLYCGKIENKKESEIPKIRELIIALDVKGELFTLDALHCQKKTLETIFETENHYIVQIKGNQPNLLEQVKINTSNEKAYVSYFEEVTNARGRKEIRKTFIYKDISGISSEWVGVKRLIRVERTVITKKKTTHETSYYMSSASSNKASFFAKHIRNHWGIENRLHWVKDVSMNEDKSKTRGGMAAENISILRNIVINLFRTNGYDSIKYATEVCNNNFKELTRLIYCKPVIRKIA